MNDDSKLIDLSDDALASWLERKRDVLARARRNFDESVAELAKLDAALAQAEANASPEVQALRAERADAKLRHTGRMGAHQMALTGLAAAQAEVKRREIECAQAKLDVAEATMNEQARLIGAAISAMSEQATEMFSAFREAQQAVRSAYVVERRVSGMKPVPQALNVAMDPYAERIVLDRDQAGVHEVMIVLEKFDQGKCDAQITRKLAAEQQATMQAQRAFG
jgi:hypothetical protein